MTCATEAFRAGLSLRTAIGAQVAVAVERLVIGGWTGRDRDAVARYVDGLVSRGFARPSSLPCYYELSPGLMTHADAIDVLGDTTSGEAEVVLISAYGEIYVGLGSDHTDRSVAPQSVVMAKQLCAKPVARDVWRLAEVADHWDELVLSSRIVENGENVKYQHGTLAELIPLDELAGVVAGSGSTATALFCGTVTAMGGIRPSGRFSMRLEDPRTGHSIDHAYLTRSIPMVN